jgi:signal transduction histidine kinase
VETATTKNADPRFERRFAGSTPVSANPQAGEFGSSAPIVLPERARPRPSPTPAQLERLGMQTASIAHDFNNLLSVIMVCASEIIGEPDDGTHIDRAEEILEAATRGAELSRRLLGNERIEPTSEGSEIVAIDLAIIDSLSLLERTLGPGIELSLASDGHLPQVRLASGEIQRVLLNLAANSRDAMPDGGEVAIRTGIVSIPPGDHCLGTGWHVRIAFADEGAGMSPEIAQRAVEPYFSTKFDREGTGLGLATVSALLRSVGGDLRINSRVGSGTTISVYLPAIDTYGKPLSLPGRHISLT